MITKSAPHACAAMFVMLAAACGGPSAPVDEAAAGAAPAPAGESACPDDGARLPVTGICAGRASAYLDPSVELIADTPDGCTWGFTELPFPLGDEALVYRALSCNGVTTALQFHGGARSAALGYAASALYAPDLPDSEPVRIFVSDPADPQKVLRDLFEGIPEAERARCQIRPLSLSGAPADALVIEYSDAERAREPMDEPITMCGEFGRDEDAASFWRIFGGYAWFFSLGQDITDFDPNSFMMFRKAADGSWSPAP